MTQVIQHWFSRKDKIPIFASQAADRVVGFLLRGEWMGVIDSSDQYMRVITVCLDGWVRKSDCVHPDKKAPLTIQRQGDIIRYFLPTSE